MSLNLCPHVTTPKWLLPLWWESPPTKLCSPPTPQWVAGGGRPAAAAPPILPLLLFHPLIPIVSTHTSDGPNSKFFLNVSIPLGLLYVECFWNSPKGKSQFWQSGSAQGQAWQRSSISRIYLVLLKILLKCSPKCDQSVCQSAGIMHNQGRSWGANRVNPLHDPAAIWVPVLVTRRLHAGRTLGLIELWHVSLVMVETCRDLCALCVYDIVKDDFVNDLTSLKSSPW